MIAEKGPDGKAGRILGVHMVGPWVTEQLSGGYLAVNWEATVDEVAEFIQPHPSLTELFGETVLTPHRPQLQRLRPRPEEKRNPMAEVTLPQLGETVTEGTITQWFKQVGDTVAADEPLFEVSTDKVDTEVPSPVAGTLTEIRVPEGETVDVGTVIAVVGDGDGAPAERAGAGGRGGAGRGGAGDGGARRRGGARARAGWGDRSAGDGDARRRARAGRGQGRGAGPRAGAGRAEPEPEPAAPAASSAKGVLLSPVVRRLVNEHGLDPAAITGSGPGGRITRDDVLDHIDKVGATPAAPQRRAGARRRGAGREGGSRRRRRRRPRPRRRLPPPSRRPRRRSPPGSATRRSR